MSWLFGAPEPEPSIWQRRDPHAGPRAPGEYDQGSDSDDPDVKVRTFKRTALGRVE